MVRSPVLLLILSTILSSCGWRYLTPRAENPVTEDYLGGILTTGYSDYGVLSTTASRRLIMAPMSGPHVGKFCAEPPPDVGEAFASSFSAAGSGSGTTPGSAGTAEIKAQAEFHRAIATAIAALLRRSQGLQWARDQRTALCVDYLNGALSATQYEEAIKRVERMSFDLIREEIPRLADVKLPEIVAPPVVIAPTKKDTDSK
jgi:hypothetical protein